MYFISLDLALKQQQIIPPKAHLVMLQDLCHAANRSDFTELIEKKGKPRCHLRILV